MKNSKTLTLLGLLLVNTSLTSCDDKPSTSAIPLTGMAEDQFHENRIYLTTVTDETLQVTYDCKHASPGSENGMLEFYDLHRERFPGIIEDGLKFIRSLTPYSQNDYAQLRNPDNPDVAKDAFSLTCGDTQYSAFFPVDLTETQCSEATQCVAVKKIADLPETAKKIVKLKAFTNH